MTGQAGGRYGIGGTEHGKVKGGKSKSKSKGESGNAKNQKPPAEKQQ